MAEAHIVDLDENPNSISHWKIVNIPSRLTVTETFTEHADGSGSRRFIFEGPPGAYAVKLRIGRTGKHRGPEEKAIEFTLDETPQAAPGYIGAEMIE